MVISALPPTKDQWRSMSLEISNDAIFPIFNIIHLFVFRVVLKIVGEKGEAPTTAPISHAHVEEGLLVKGLALVPRLAIIAGSWHHK